jgi:hypothetical protein
MEGEGQVWREIGGAAGLEGGGGGGGEGGRRVSCRSSSGATSDNG